MKKKYLILLLTVSMLFQNSFAFSVMSYRNSYKNIFILMYHKLSLNSYELGDFCTTPENFEKDIIYLKNKGYKFLSATELSNHTPAPNERIAVLTFDDGYKSDIEYALPIIEKHGVKATFFIIGSFIGTEGHLSEEDILVMSKSPYVEIGNHSYNIHLKPYNKIEEYFNQYPNDAVADFDRNNKLLEKITQNKIYSLSFPNGIYTYPVDEKLKKGNIKITFSTDQTKYTKNLTVPIGRRDREHNIDISEIIK